MACRVLEQMACTNAGATLFGVLWSMSTATHNQHLHSIASSLHCPARRQADKYRSPSCDAAHLLSAQTRIGCGMCVMCTCCKMGDMARTILHRWHQTQYRDNIELHHRRSPQHPMCRCQSRSAQRCACPNQRRLCKLQDRMHLQQRKSWAV